MTVDGYEMIIQKLSLTTRAILWLLVPLLASIPAHAVTVDGFVTQIDSTGAFDSGELRVQLTAETRCSIATVSSISEWYYSVWSGRLSYSPWFFSSNDRVMKSTIMPCNVAHMAIGSQVHVIGTFQSKHRVLADHAIIYTESIDRKLESSAVIGEQPELQHNADGWKGSLWLDGYPMTVTPQTKLLAAPANARLHYSWSKTTGILETKPTRKHGSSQILFHESLSRPNACVQYVGTSDVDGKILANQLAFWPNHIGKKEHKYASWFVASIVPPNYQKRMTGGIYFKKIFKPGNVINIVPDQEAQKWVSKIGRSMVPQFQRSMSDSDPDKIRFQFYITGQFKYQKDLVRLTHAGESKHIADNNIIALPDGIILVPATTLAHLQNSAQLAALMSAAVAAVLQKQAYLYIFLNVQVAINASNKATTFMQEQQALRIGIRQMYLAGYDIREAPYAWAVAQGKSVENPIINSKHPDQEIPWYAAYAFNYISHYYQDVDYSKLKRGEKEYQQFLQELYKADPSLPRPASPPAQIQPQAHINLQAQPTPAAATKAPATAAAQAVPAQTIH